MVERIELPDVTKDDVDRAYEPIAKEIGYLLRDWNTLHERLGHFFALATGGPEELLFSIWHSVPVDRFQRNMLSAAIKFAYDADKSDVSDAATKKRSAYSELKWVLEKADALGRQRDDAVHVPIALTVDNDALGFISNDFTGNRIASQLEGKDLAREFALYRKKVTLLIRRLDDLEDYIKQGMTSALPQRPQWPSDRDSTGHR